MNAIEPIHTINIRFIYIRIVGLAGLERIVTSGIESDKIEMVI